MPFIILPNRRNWVITLTIPQFSHMLILFTVRDEAMSNEILTLQELAEYLKLNEKTAYRLAGEGKLPGFKIGGSWRFKREDLEAWIEKQKDKE